MQRLEWFQRERKLSPCCKRRVISETTLIPRQDQMGHQMENILPEDTLKLVQRNCLVHLDFMIPRKKEIDALCKRTIFNKYCKRIYSKYLGGRWKWEILENITCHNKKCFIFNSVWRKEELGKHTQKHWILLKIWQQ